MMTAETFTSAGSFKMLILVLLWTSYAIQETNGGKIAFMFQATPQRKERQSGNLGLDWAKKWVPYLGD